jgi:hypothetical protein
MRATRFLIPCLFACSTETPTAPERASEPPTLAAERETITTTFTLREQNPCNSEPVTFEVVFTLNQVLAGPADGATVLRTGTIERFTGIGDFGTQYTGQQHTNVVFHLDTDGLWGTSGRVEHMQGSVPGTSFLLISHSILERETGDIREVVDSLRCLGSEPG